VEDVNQLLLEHRVHVDEHVAAHDQIEPRERRIAVRSWRANTHRSRTCLLIR
jgi:hypothetical protein